MKKKSVKMISAVLVLAVACGAYMYMKNTSFEEETETADSTEEIMAVQLDEIKSLNFVIEKEQVTFLKTEDGWELEGDQDFPVDDSIIEEAAGQFRSITTDRTLENVEDLSEYGLDAPENVISIETDDKTYSMKIGDLNESIGQYYITMDDDDSKIYLVNESVVTAFKEKLYDYAEMGTFPDIDSSNIKKLEIIKEGQSLVIENDESTSTWTVADGETEEKADSAKAMSVVSAISTVEYEDFVDYHCEDFSVYGLDEPYGKIIINYQEEVEETEEETVEEETEEETTKVEEKQITVFIGNQAEDATRYVCIDDSKEIYTISEDVLNAFMDKKASELWNLSISDLVLNNLSELKIDYENNTTVYNVSRETLEDEDGTETEETTFWCGETEIDSTEFTVFYNKINNMTAQKRLEENYEASVEPEISVELTDLDGNKQSIDYYNYDVNFYAVVTEDKVYLVNKLNVKELIEAAVQLSEAEESTSVSADES